MDFLAMMYPKWLEYFLLYVHDWSEVLLIITGLVAFVIYRCQKRDATESAATELTEQITEIEDNLHSIIDRPFDLRNESLYQLGPILTENLWTKNRTQLSRYLSEEDRKNIQHFYAYAERVERARLDLVKCLVDTWYHKSYLEQEIIAIHYMYPSDECMNNFYDDIDKFLKDGNAFTPNICLDIMKTVSSAKMLTGTTTFQRLDYLAHLSEKNIIKKLYFLIFNKF